MNIILVRANNDCLKKEIELNNACLEQQLRKELRILSTPSSCGFTDIQKAKDLVDKIELFSPFFIETPQLRGIKQMIGKCDEEENVVLIDGDKYSNMDIFSWHTALIEKEKGRNPIEVYHYFKYDFQAKFFPRYEMLFFADMGYDLYVGEKDKDKRCCRFCGKSGPNIFGDKKNAHAISYFLGNNAIFCLEECLECNNEFGKGIEQDLMNYYGYYRAAEGRLSRTSKKPLSAIGMNYEQAGNSLKIFADEPMEGMPKVGEKIPKEGFLVHLSNKEPVVLHNVYRVLVKYVIACIPNMYLPEFRVTIDWVKGKKKPRKGSLPPVYRYEKLDNIEKPSLCVYIRKDDKMDMPYCVGEIRFMECLYVFAIPYCKKDVMKEYLDRPLKKFVSQRFPNIDFTVENFCDYEDKMIINHVKIEGEPNTILKPLRDTIK